LQPNIYFINVAKSLAIASVVMGHLPVEERLSAFINSFHIPLFFIISGYLLHTEGITFIQFAIKKLRTLIVPYYVFAVITFIIWYLVGRKFGGDADGGYDTFQYLVGVALAFPSKDFIGFNLPLWFLPSLFCAALLMYPILRIKNVVLQAVVVGCCCMAGFLWHAAGGAGLPLGCDVSLFAVLFLFVGKKAAQLSPVLRLSPLLRFSLAILSIALCVIVSQINAGEEHVDMYRYHFNNVMLFLITAFSGSAAVLLFSAMLPEIKPFNFFGRNTIVIMSLNLLCFSALKGVQLFIFHIPLEALEESLLLQCLYVALTFVLLAPVIYLINKYIPELLGRKR